MLRHARGTQDLGVDLLRACWGADLRQHASMQQLELPICGLHGCMCTYTLGSGIALDTNLQGFCIIVAL